MTRPDFDYAARIATARREMELRTIDAVLLSIGSDLPYLTGYRAMESERLTMLVLTRDDAVLVVPVLEAPRVEQPPVGVEVRAWTETEDPLAIVASMLPGGGTAAIGDQTWTRFTLGIADRAPALRLVPAGSLMAVLRLRKDDEEIACLAAAGAAADRVATRLASMRFSSLSERDLARMVAAMTVEEGHDGAAFTIVASGPNAASPHHEPGNRTIEPGDTVVVDFGGTVAGYHSDTTRTFSVGPPEPEVAEAHAALMAAQEAGVAAASEGVAAEAVDAAARSVLEEVGYGEYFIHRTGHGIGLDVHEDPYLVEGNPEPLSAGMVFSVEPGIYVPGRYGMRIEDIVTVTADGPRRLNRSDRSLLVVA